MEILILTGKFGMGHWSAALSLQEQLERDGHHAQVIDFFDYAMPDLPRRCTGASICWSPTAAASTTCSTA